MGIENSLKQHDSNFLLGFHPLKWPSGTEWSLPTFVGQEPEWATGVRNFSREGPLLHAHHLPILKSSTQKRPYIDDPNIIGTFHSNWGYQQSGWGTFPPKSQGCCDKGSPTTNRHHLPFFRTNTKRWQNVTSGKTWKWHYIVLEIAGNYHFSTVSTDD